MADDPSLTGAGETGEPAVSEGAESPFARLEPQDGAAAGTNGQAANGQTTNGRSANGAALELVFDVPVRLSVELGRAEISIRDVVNLGRGSIIELDRGPGMPLDVRVNGVLIGRGEVVLVDDEKLGLRFVEVVSQSERVKRSV